jgi:hypothetical protein
VGEDVVSRPGCAVPVNWGCHWSHHTQPVSSFMCIWVSGWHALVQIIAPGEPLSGGYSSPQNGRGISEPALWADAPELPASAPLVMSASLVRPAHGCPPHSAADGVDAVHGNLRCRSGIERLIGAGHRSLARTAVPVGPLVARVPAGAMAGAVSVAFTISPFLARARRGIGFLMGGRWLPGNGGWFHPRGR